MDTADCEDSALWYLEELYVCRVTERVEAARAGVKESPEGIEIREKLGHRQMERRRLGEDTVNCFQDAEGS